ncbi:MAG: winged helix-turn-helix transcriptional regulator [Chloroflexi bacterium]|nr:winged helix-turn-helix transcriptional regulator [Chloroflexota bacterium]
MQSTKQQIMDHIKRSGGSTVDGLATALGLARMTVRQHLAALERDGMVVSREERRRTGRPHFLFTLSDRGQELFPKRYDRLADLALQEVAFLDAEDIAGLNPEEKKRLLLSKMAERVYLQHQMRVQGKSLPDRVATVTKILEEEGGLAEWRAEDQQYEIVDYNCVYRRVADSHDDLCHWHLTLLSRLLGHDVECNQFQSRGAECCRFVVRQEGPSQAGT